MQTTRLTQQGAGDPFDTGSVSLTVTPAELEVIRIALGIQLLFAAHDFSVFSHLWARGLLPHIAGRNEVAILEKLDTFASEVTAFVKSRPEESFEVCQATIAMLKKLETELK